MPDSRYIVDVIYMHLHVAALPWYITSVTVVFCRLINVDIVLLFLTLFIRYKAEMKDNRHIIDAIYTCTFSSLFRDRIDINLDI